MTSILANPMVLIVVAGIAAALAGFVLCPRISFNFKEVYERNKGQKTGALYLISPLLEIIAGSVAQFGGPKVDGHREKVKKQLTAAGFRGMLTSDEFIALQTVTGIVVALTLMRLCMMLENMKGIVSGLNILVSVPIMLLLGFMLPMIILNDQVKKRHKKISRELPYTLDMITSAVEAGLDFAGAMQRIVSLAKRGPLQQEINYLLQQIRLGKTRADALRELADRVNLTELNSVVGAMIQADQLGASLGPILTIQSDELRTKRFQRAEKLALEAPVKMLGPLVGCIFPAVFVILLGPIFLKIITGGM